MLFNSFDYALFLCVVVPLYFLLPLLLRPTLLAAASYYFYMYAHPEWWWVLFGCTVIAYLSGLALERWREPLQRRAVLVAAIAANAGLLVYFKYADWLISTFNQVAHAKVSLLHAVLPVGISFFTFQALSYVFDVYRGRFAAEHRFDIFAAYKAFFPQLVAGPIERPANVIPQLKIEHRWNYERVASGLQLILWGLFKKLVIADRLAVFVKGAYSLPHNHTGLQLLLASYAFAFQIFCDFSAYTDIARGTARILGINLMENFRAPYFARSIPEFWSRWHIKLSPWFRDYHYIPMGGNRVPWLRWQFNILVVFVVSGVWHGADWKFAIWGLLHAIYFLLANALAKIPWQVALPRFGEWLWNAAKVLVTFHLVVLAWVFFRAESMKDALYILRKIAKHPFKGPALTNYFGWQEAMIALGAIVLLEAVHLLHGRVNAREFLATRPIFIRWPAYYALILAVVFYAKQGRQEFIYFQF
jgi:D-alanyl-lipoteichoic acid acyltransferase DltB (MBOAT superfamily)